ncbi:hypothetical protein BRD02_02630 [Halobacteriales archaeon QS_8_69_73]|nr:MAG: hypothetical protein BRD02_02630 [Halobacteriales archaeon QS_8_69_73]
MTEPTACRPLRTVSGVPSASASSSTLRAVVTASRQHVQLRLAAVAAGPALCGGDPGERADRHHQHDRDDGATTHATPPAGRPADGRVCRSGREAGPREKLPSLETRTRE